MPRSTSLLLVALALPLACTRGSEVAATTREAQPQPSPAPALVERAQPEPRPRCNHAVPNLEAALRHARQLVPDPAFVEFPSDWEDVHVELWLLPAVPTRWPAQDCRLVFYLFSWFEVEPKPRDGLYWDEPLPYAWLGIEGKITVALDTGVSMIEPVSGRPGGSNPMHGTGPMATADQQPLFDAVVSGSGMSAEGIATYHRWFTNQPRASTMYWIWHREFFDAVVGTDEPLRTEISNAAKGYLSGAGPANWTDFETWVAPSPP